MTTHLLRDGTWVDCAHPASCSVRFHVPLTAAEAALLPKPVLYSLLEAIDPPHDVDIAGAKMWFSVGGHLHRDYDLPALIHPDGALTWYSQGFMHRGDDKPAFTTVNGTRIWYQYGDKHRDDDKPAVLLASGQQQWYQKGNLHRTTGPAVIYADGTDDWCLDGKFMPEAIVRRRSGTL